MQTTRATRLTKTRVFSKKKIRQKWGNNCDTNIGLVNGSIHPSIAGNLMPFVVPVRLSSGSEAFGSTVWVESIRLATNGTRTERKEGREKKGEEKRERTMAGARWAGECKKRVHPQQHAAFVFC